MQDYLPATGNGCIWLHLDSVSTGHDAREEFTALLRAVDDTITPFGEFVPADVLKRYGRVPDIL